MSTSGSTDFTLNSRQIIDHALQLIGALQEGDSPSTARANEAATSLNLMLKTWGASERLWLFEEGEVTLVAGQRAYVLGSDVRQVTSVRRRVANMDTPLNQLSRSDYQDTPTKLQTGLPNSWFYDRQRTTRTLYVWMVPDAAIAAQYTLPYTYTRVIDDIDTLDDEADLPQEWLEVLAYNLAVRLGPRYGGIDTVEWAEIKEQAGSLLALLPTRDQEEGSVYVAPGWQ